MSLNASYITLVILFLRFVFKKAPKWILCLSWAIVGLRLVMPFSFESIVSLLPSAEVIPDNIAQTHTPTIDSGIPVINEAINPILSSTLSPAPGASVNPMQIVLFVASCLWLIGVGIMLLYALIAYLRLKIRVAPSIRLQDNVYLCDTIDTPFIFGILRPRIYLPSGMEKKHIPHVLAHEWAHLHRRDHFFKPLGFLLLSIYWFNPLLWVAYICLCRDIESACDEKVIASMTPAEIKGYSEALAFGNTQRKIIAVCPLAFGEVGVKARIKSLLHYKKPAFWIIIVSLVLCTALAIGFLTNPKDTPDTDVTTTEPTADTTTEPTIEFPSPTNALTYALLPDQTGYAVTGIGNSTDPILVIPREYNGKPVVQVGGTAFMNNSTIEKLYLPDSITMISDAAFAFCTKLNEIVFSSDTLTIADKAFWGCTALTKLELSKGSITLGESTFQACSALKEVRLSEKMPILSGFTFMDCTSLESITIPEGVGTIGPNAFYGCTSLSNVTIPKSVYRMYSGAFAYCTSLKTIDVSKDNLSFHMEGNCLIESRKNRLVWGNELSLIPKTVEIIDSSAFDGCSTLTEITIPDSVKEIGTSAFNDCRSLSKIVIPKSVEIMGRTVFRQCLNLTIYCEATEKPVKWDPNWNQSPDHPVVWGYTGE